MRSQALILKVVALPEPRGPEFDHYYFTIEAAISRLVHFAHSAMSGAFTFGWFVRVSSIALYS